jgi:hypothetical protein
MFLMSYNDVIHAAGIVINPDWASGQRAQSLCVRLAVCGTVGRVGPGRGTGYEKAKIISGNVGNQADNKVYYEPSESLKNAVIWDVAPCGFIINRRFGGTCRLHLQGRANNVSGEKCYTMARVIFSTFLRNVGS